MPTPILSGMNRLIISVIILVIGLTSGSLLAQRVSAVKAVNLQDSVKISFTLTDTLPDASYRISVLAITSEDTVELKELSGAYGEGVTPGNREIIWYSYREWQRFRGPVRFQVKAVPHFRFLSPEELQMVRRGKGITFSWYGDFATEDTIRLELYSYETRLQTVARLRGAGEYIWQVPSNLALGDGYRVRLVGLERSPVDEFSQPFIVTRRIPLGAQIGAGATVVAGAIVAYALRWLPKPFLADERD